MRTTLLLTFISVLAVGCSDSNRQAQSPIQRLSSGDADMLSANQSHFERSEDPPLKANTYFAAGQLAESQGQPARAAEQYKEAIKLDPYHQLALYRLGILYATNQQYAEAVEVWKMYLKATDNSAQGWANLAFCYDLSGKTKDAESAFKSGIKKEPNNKACRVNYGLMLARLGRKEDAIVQLSAVLKAPEVHYDLGSIYEKMGKKDDAKSEYEHVLELDPQFWEAQTRLSELETE